MTRSDDLISVLTEDHRELLQLLTEVEYLSGGESLRRTLTDQLIVEMVRHSVAEESYLYPSLCTYIPDGGRIAREAYEDHQRLDEILKRLEGTSLPDEEFSRLLSLLIIPMRDHIGDEEHRVFPLLGRCASREELVALGEQAAKAKAEAPSRPEPSRPDLPLLHTLVRNGYGLVERVREHLCGRGKAYPGTR